MSATLRPRSTDPVFAPDPFLHLIQKPEAEMALFPILRKLVDAQKMHRQHPDTFEVPSAHELAAIVPGDYVKICRGNERFWCRIDGAAGKYLIGTVDTPLVNEENADINIPGLRVRIEHRHIYSVMKR